MPVSEAPLQKGGQGTLTDERPGENFAHNFQMEMSAGRLAQKT